MLTGIATDYCVYYSAIDAANLDFGVTLVTDGCRGIDVEGSLAAAEADMRARGVKFAASGELI